MLSITFYDAFYHSDISLLDNLIFGLNMIGALAASWCNGKASTVYRLPHSVRRVFFITSGFALIYAMSYMALFVADLSVLNWGSIMRGVSLLVWPLVWIGPAYTISRHVLTTEKNITQEVADEIEYQVQEVKTQVKKDI